MAEHFLSFFIKQKETMAQTGPFVTATPQLFTTLLLYYSIVSLPNWLWHPKWDYDLERGGGRKNRSSRRKLLVKTEILLRQT